MNQPAATPAAVVAAFVDAMAAMDFETAVTLVSQDLEYVNGPRPAVRGPAGVIEELTPFFGPIEENEFRVLRQAAAGNVVIVERLDRHRIGSHWFELPVTGVFEVADGRIRYWRDYFDMGTLMAGMEGQ